MTNLAGTPVVYWSEHGECDPPVDSEFVVWCCGLTPQDHPCTMYKSMYKSYKQGVICQPPCTWILADHTWSFVWDRNS